MSTKALSIMQLGVTEAGATEMEGPIDQVERLPLGTHVRVLIRCERLDLGSNEPADGGRPPSSEDLGFAYRLPFETNRKVLALHVKSCST